MKSICSSTLPQTISYKNLLLVDLLVYLVLESVLWLCHPQQAILLVLQICLPFTIIPVYIHLYLRKYLAYSWPECHI